MINNTFKDFKDYSAIPKKKAHCFADKTFIVIDEAIVQRLSIDDETWFEQEVIEEGILLRIYHKNKGIGELH